VCLFACLFVCLLACLLVFGCLVGVLSCLVMSRIFLSCLVVSCLVLPPFRPCGRFARQAVTVQFCGRFAHQAVPFRPYGRFGPQAAAGRQRTGPGTCGRIAQWLGRRLETERSRVQLLPSPCLWLGPASLGAVSAPPRRPNAPPFGPRDFTLRALGFGFRL
jgi:hypothetical protein